MPFLSFSRTLSLLALLGSLEYVSPSPIQGRGSPTGSLSLARRFNVTSTGFPNIVAADQARAAELKKRGLEITGVLPSSGSKTKRQSSFPVTNAAVIYTADVGIGSPPTQYTLLVDTGSSNTWVGAGKGYQVTSSSSPTGQVVTVKYGSGEFAGTEWTDTVTLDPDLVIKKQSIGVAAASQGFSGFDGILGVGPTDLTQGTIEPSTTTIPTVTDNLYAQGKIPAKVLGVYFQPTTQQSDVNGELTFGGVDDTKTISFTPITATSPASAYWGIDQEIRYGSTTILGSTAGIVDTGTTLVLIASDAFSQYQSLTGGVPDSSTGLLAITPDQYDNLQPLQFVVGDNTFTLTPNAQIWPRALNTAIGGSADKIYLIVNSIGSPSGQGLDFINGYTFLERYYSVFDTTNNRVGFAATPFTDATSN